MTTDMFTRAEVLALIEQSDARVAPRRVNTRFQVQAGDLTLLQAAADARGQHIGAAARDLALAHLRGAAAVSPELMTVLHVLASDVASIKAKLDVAPSSLSGLTSRPKPKSRPRRGLHNI
jgi:hypothetical protein